MKTTYKYSKITQWGGN